MSHLSYKTHYMNKYPGGRVLASENQIDVYDAQGRHPSLSRKTAPVNGPTKSRSTVSTTAMI